MPENFGEKFLHKKYPELQKSEEVEHEITRLEKRGEKPKKQPEDKIASWLKILERTHGHEEPEVQERIKNYYHRKYIIKPEDVPESYFELQRRIARERGYGDIDIPEEAREQMIDTIIKDQERSLDSWIDYLCQKDSPYPTWFKYYTFRNVTQLSEYDKEKKEFKQRTKTTTGLFPDINREALAYVYDSLVKTYGPQREKHDDEEFQKLLEGANFSKLYSWAIEKITPASQEDREQIDGRWVKYDQGSDATPLFESLQGKGTGWCTAGEETAKTQLKTGDFYVYYTKDTQGEYSVPRIAIRMEHGQIAEVRGVADNHQNLEPQMMDIAEEKMKELPGAEKFKKRTDDMRRLTEIENKVNNGGELTKEDLRFLYEIDDKIEGFGYTKDPRIEELLSGRDIKADLAFLIGCKEEEISITEEEALKGNIKYHYGNLDLRSLTSAEGLKLPETIGGYLDLSSLRSAEGLTLPETIGGDFNLYSLTSAEGLRLPERIGGDLNLSSLTSAEGLKLPERIGGYLDLSSLRSAEGLELPEKIGGDLYLSSLTSAEGLKLPETIGGYLDLSSLRSAEGLKLPEIIGGGLYLRSLTSAEGLKLPETIGGYLDLSSLRSAEGLKLPEIIGGGLNLSSLRSAEGLELPEKIEGDLYLSSLISAEGLKLPERIGGYLNLSSLRSAEGLKLPEIIGGGLILNSLTSAEGLTLPEIIEGDLYLSSLISAEGLKLPERIGRHLYLSSLTSAEGLKLPEIIGGGLYLSSLRSAEGLELPEKIGGDLDLFNLTSAEKEKIKKEYPHLTII